MAATTTLNLRRLEVENFLRVRALTVDADGRHVVITGPNCSGKTSCVDAIWTALGGKPAREIPEPISRGAHKASIRLDLGDYLVERIFSDKGTRLIVTAADGSRVARPQQLLDGLLGKYALDPIAFLERRPRDQVDDVLGIVGVVPPVESVRNLTGEAHPPLPNESADSYLMRLSADETGLYYIRRRDAHRVLDQKAAALQEQRQIVAQLGGPLNGEKEASASDLLARIEWLNKQADERRSAFAAADEVKGEHARLQGDLDRLRTEKDRNAERQERLRQQIGELMKQLAAEEESGAALATRIEAGVATVQECHDEYTALAQAAGALPDPAPEIARLRAEVQNVERTNTQRSKHRHACEELDRLARELEDSKLGHEKLDAVLTDLRHLRAHQLDGHEIGVTGLEVGDGELRLNGVSFQQASQAEKIKTACCIAMKQKPRLRLLRVDEGERLDSASKHLLLEIADQNGFQVVMTAVADGDGLKVEIVNGD